MVRPVKTWCILPAVRELSADLGRELGVSPVVTQILINRGIKDSQTAERFFCCTLEGLGDSGQLLGMKAAVERIKYAIEKQQKITIYGDYDVDGITSTALVYLVLKRLGAAVEYYIPERQGEGYGLNGVALESICAAGSELVITVDCGIAGVAEVAGLFGRMDFIITDHHQPPAELPNAWAIINPKQAGCTYPDKQLAGVGVAFKLCQALLGQFGKRAWEKDYLALVALGTIADIVPLVGENRILVSLGLAEFRQTTHLGLQELLKVCRVPSDTVDAGKVGFVLAPRLNAAGRLSHATAGVELLVTEDRNRAAELAGELEAENIRRQAVEKELLAMASTLLATSDIGSNKVLVLAGDNWHSGVLGIVAARLVDQYYRPVVMISLKAGIGKGSCRSIPGFDIYKALDGCSDLLVQFGGHKQAAGLTIDEANIAELQARLNGFADEWLTDNDFVPVLTIDSLVNLDEVTGALLEQLACLAPHGMGNPSPVFVSKGLSVRGVRPLGQDGRHFKIRVAQNGCSSDVLAWNMEDRTAQLESGTAIDLAFVPEFNEWKGQRSIQLLARDVKTQNLSDGVILVDARLTVDKIGYVGQLALEGKQVLVLMNDSSEALRLAGKLRSLQSSWPGRVGYVHPAQPNRRKESIASSWRDGKLSVLVAVDLANGWDKVKHVVQYQPPLDWLPLIKSCEQRGDDLASVHIHSLYGGGEVRQMAKQLCTLWPDREVVGQCYLVLKGVAGQHDGVRLTNRQLVKKVHQTYGVPLTEVGVAAAISILEELGLLCRSDVGVRRLLYLQPEPAGKLAIDQSNVFRRCAKSREEFSRWVGDLQQASVEKLWIKAMRKGQ